MTVAPNANDLTTLSVVKSYLHVTAATDDDLLQRLVTNLSRAALTWCNRDSFYGRTVTAALEATQNASLIMPEFPVTSVSGLSTTGGSIPAANPPSPTNHAAPSGYLLEAWNGIPPGGAQKLSLYGYGFVRTVVGITYRVGYEVLAEAGVVAAAAYTPVAAYGPPMADSGVLKASDGTPFVKVAGTPAQGQYSFSPGIGYTFNVADNGVGILVSYSFAPADVAQAVTEWVCERYKYRDRMGEMSRTVATQQTAAYDLSALPKYVAEILAQYRAVGPLF